MHLRVIVGSALILVAMAAIAVANYFASQEAYYTIDQFAEAPEAAAYRPQSADESVKRLQLRGEVDSASVVRADEGLQMQFDLAGKNDRVAVLYRGIVPDTFDLAESVTVGGVFSPEGTFVADQLFVQCPSKYEALPPGEHALDANG